jgi:multidrug efflux pump subunit AcrB
VLIPLLFMGDVVGRLFHEFAITLAVSILISLVVSLTLTPMMCARMLPDPPAHGTVKPGFLDAVIARYGVWLDWVLLRQRATLLVTIGTLVLTAVLYVIVPKGFFPVQDNAAILAVTEAPQSVSFAAMAERQQALARIVRLDRSPLGSRVAAALLAREWQQNDPAWGSMRGRIAAGLGASTRPAAAFLRSVVAFSSADSGPAQEQPLADAAGALAQLAGPVADGAGAEAAGGGV